VAAHGIAERHAPILPLAVKQTTDQAEIRIANMTERKRRRQISLGLQRGFSSSIVREPSPTFLPQVYSKVVGSRSILEGGRVFCSEPSCLLGVFPISSSIVRPLSTSRCLNQT
jgi:hypothetical protein